MIQLVSIKRTKRKSALHKFNLKVYPESLDLENKPAIHASLDMDQLGLDKVFAVYIIYKTGPICNNRGSKALTK